MDRLTRRKKTGEVLCAIPGEECVKYVGICSRCPHEDEAWERLAEYEETGLFPVDVRDLKENDRVEREVLTRINFLSVEDLAAAYCQVKAERDALFATIQKRGGY